MKVMAISTREDVAERYAAARQHGYIAFIYDHADPLRILTREKFLYVRNDTELLEKISLLKADPFVIEQLQRA